MVRFADRDLFGWRRRNLLERRGSYGGALLAQPGGGARGARCGSSTGCGCWLPGRAPGWWSARAAPISPCRRGGLPRTVWSGWWWPAATARCTRRRRGWPAAPPLLGLVLLGTGNDLAGTLGVPRGLDAAVGRALHGPVRRFDLVKIGETVAIGYARRGLRLGGDGLCQSGAAAAGAPGVCVRGAAHAGDLSAAGDEDRARRRLFRGARDVRRRGQPAAVRRRHAHRARGAAGRRLAGPGGGAGAVAAGAAGGVPARLSRHPRASSRRWRSCASGAPRSPWIAR